MAVQVKASDIINDLKSLSTAIYQYNDQMSAYLSDPVTNPHPDLVSIINAIKMDNIATHLYSNSRSSNGIEMGTLAESTDQSFAISREVALRGFIKSDFYDQGTGDKVQERDAAVSSEGAAMNVIRGKIRAV